MKQEEIFAKLKDVVRSMSRNKKINNVYLTEDVEQEMYLRLLKDMPKLQTISEDEIVRYARVVIKTGIINLIKSQAVRPDTSIYATEAYHDITVEEMEGRSSITETISDANKFTSPHDTIVGLELSELILSWAEQKDESTKTFLSEIINPSQEVLEMYEEKIGNRKSSKSYIPPFTLGRMLKLNDSKIYSIMRGLSDYLKECGYSYQGKNFSF